MNPSRIKPRVAFLLVTLTVPCVAALAEPMYVSDKLVVSVYPEASQEGERLTTLDSGDAVEAIEKSEGFTHVKLPDGRDGWVKSSYLSTQAPAIVRLKELEKEKDKGAGAANAAALEELKSAKEQNAALHIEIENLKKAASQTKSSEKPTIDTPSAPSRRNDDSNETDYVHVAKWGGSIALVMGILGFATGYRTLAKRIERKYGNLRIY